ncbi:hypothetical protein [Actinoplanes xinjiangensis]|uniref:ATP dependent DNA ligase n=1 Tax=Actinoplanes xinjiangensis TaxID=512350 RepID=UPI0034280C41
MNGCPATQASRYRRGRCGPARYAGRVATVSPANRGNICGSASIRSGRPTPPCAEATGMADATWVKPRLVAQVAYRTWPSSGLMRHPLFRSVHEDRDVSAATLPEGRSA